jgi:hypothetical protein
VSLFLASSFVPASALNTSTSTSTTKTDTLRSTASSSARLDTVTMMPVQVVKKLNEFVEEEDESVFDELDDIDFDVNTLEENKSRRVQQNDDGEADPFDDITFEDNVNQDEDVLLSKTFLRVIAQLSPKNEEKTVLDACEKLVIQTKQKQLVIEFISVSNLVVFLCYVCFI